MSDRPIEDYLRVACPFCAAPVGEMCRVVKKSGRRQGEPSRKVHDRRKTAYVWTFMA